MTTSKNEFFEYNLPLQYWAKHADPEDVASPIVGAEVLNYMPRRSRCDMIDLADCLNGQSHAEFCEDVARHFENLARMWREVAADPAKCVYYHDEGMS